jgi:dolichyl-phosphate-mannose-protein mannosyltransferase
VLLLGNPVVWWFGTLAALWAVVAWAGRRDWRYGLVVVGIGVTWLPWLRYDDRPIFSYYAVSILPFVVLGSTLLIGELLGRGDASAGRRAAGVAVAGTVLVLTVMAFAWFWPIWTDQLVTNREWLARMWFKRWI